MQSKIADDSKPLESKTPNEGASATRKRSVTRMWNSLRSRTPAFGTKPSDIRKSLRLHANRLATHFLDPRPSKALTTEHFRKLKSIGSGTFGEVFLAEVLPGAHIPLPSGTKVALKCVRPKSFSWTEQHSTRIERIAHSRVCDHLNIATLFEAFRDSVEACLVIEFVPGGTVRDAMSDARQARKAAKEGGHNFKTFGLPETIAVAIARQVAEALAHMHMSGVIHRDIKSRNVILKNKWTPEMRADTVSARVVDFGLAEVLPGKKSNEGKQKPLMSKNYNGTVEYMAPEQHARERHDGVLVDSYALGIMLFEMIAGQRPFYSKEEDDEEEMLALKEKGPVFGHKAWANVSEKTQLIVNGLLQGDPKKRLDITTAIGLLGASQKVLNRKSGEK